MLTFGAIAAKYRPKWLVWENVPGVLSSNGGADFGAFLGMLGELGYGFAYRVLDAQYFGVAQRRRRVFVVGCLGDWRRAAAVLFERHSLQGHPAPSRKARQDVAPTIRAGAANGGPGHGARSGDSKDELIVPVAKSLRGQPNASNREDSDTYIPVATLCVATGQAGAEIGVEIASTLNCNHEAPYISHAVPVNIYGGNKRSDRPEGGFYVRLDESTSKTLDAATGLNPTCSQGGTAVLAVTIPINDMATRHAGTDGSGNQNGKGHGLGIGGETDPMFTLTKGDKHAVATFQQSSMKGKGTIGYDTSGIAKPVKTQVDGQMLHTAMAVRRLTPVECARLQGFPDDYLNITVRGKPAADGPKYKALGNSWATPNVRWIGERIQAVEQLNRAQAAIETVADEVTA